MDLLARNRAKPAAGSNETELLRSQERELAQELQARLQRDPSGWGDVLEVLSQDDPRIGREIVGSLRDAVGDGAEAPLLQLLKAGRHREMRLSTVTLISSRTSSASLWALVAAAQEDADAGVRYRALSELAMRQGRIPADAATIEPLLRLRAQTDPDAEVRRFALRVAKN
jgi:hypothetical protein